MKTNDNPGVYLPPPILYAAFFFLSLFLQNLFPLGNTHFPAGAYSVAGWTIIGTGLVFLIPALLRFLFSKNTLVTIKPAHSLQTSGIYSFTRNPMYLALLLIYCGLAFLKGNWWTLVLVPFLVLTVQLFIIKKEENYLQRRFGESYLQYKKQVRRWL